MDTTSAGGRYLNSHYSTVSANGGGKVFVSGVEINSEHLECSTELCKALPNAEFASRLMGVFLGWGKLS